MKKMEEKNSVIGNRMGLWDKSYKNKFEVKLYDDPTTGKVAGGFLNDQEIAVVEDWGCGLGGFQAYMGPGQEYVGIDGSLTVAASKIVDLETYITQIDAIHMRHILEHNPGWARILNNALNSFRKRMVLTLFTPFQEKTQVIKKYPNFNDTGMEMIDIGFQRSDIVSEFHDIAWFSIENIKTGTQYGVEHMFFLKK